VTTSGQATLFDETTPPSLVCWHDDGRVPRGHDCVSGADRMLWTYGRCRSGSRWFWAARCYDWRAGADEELLEHGWSDSEDGALGDARAAIERCAAGRPAIAYVRQHCAYQVLKQVNSAKRRARPPKPGANSAAVVEYLYEPWSWSDDYGETDKGISEVPIVKKTAKRIYYDVSDRWDERDGVVKLGFISRQEFESDTRCATKCPREIPVQVCGPHGHAGAHCVHRGQEFRHPPAGRHYGGGCGEDCPRGISATKCAEHGYTWDHCPHGESPCHHGYPAGQARRPGGRWYDHGGMFFTTREAAEQYLYSADRERERQRQEAEPEIRRLRREMAAVHPDRGGTDEEFIAARKRYEEALRRAS
jgi:hypothetical protein